MALFSMPYFVSWIRNKPSRYDVVVVVATFIVAIIIDTIIIFAVTVAVTKSEVSQ